MNSKKQGAHNEEDSVIIINGIISKKSKIKPTCVAPIPDICMCKENWMMKIEAGMKIRKKRKLAVRYPIK